MTNDSDQHQSVYSLEKQHRFSRYELTNFTFKDSDKVFRYHICVPTSESFYHIKINQWNYSHTFACQSFEQIADGNKITHHVPCGVLSAQVETHILHLGMQGL